MMLGLVLFFLSFIGLMFAISFGLMFPVLDNDPVSRWISKAGIVVAAVCGVLFFVVIGSWE